MPKFLADEDFNNRIVRGIRRNPSEIDIVRVHEVGLIGDPDVLVLEWAAIEGRVVLTHDVATMIGIAYDRIRDGIAFPGLIAVSQFASIGRVIEEIVQLASIESSHFEGQVLYIPWIRKQS